MEERVKDCCLTNINNKSDNILINDDKKIIMKNFTPETLLSTFYIKQNLVKEENYCNDIKNDGYYISFINSKGNREQLPYSVHLDSLSILDKFKKENNEGNKEKSLNKLDSKSKIEKSYEVLSNNENESEIENPEESLFKSVKDSVVFRMASTRAQSVINNQWNCHDDNKGDIKEAENKIHKSILNNQITNIKTHNYPKVYDYLIEDYPELKGEEEKLRISKFNANNEIAKINEVKKILIEKGKATETLFCSSANKVTYNEIDNLSKRINNLSIKVNKKSLFSKNDTSNIKSNMKMSLRKKRFISEKKVYSSYINFEHKEFKIVTDNDIGIDLYWQAPLEINNRKEDDDVETDNEQLNLALSKIITDNAKCSNSILQENRKYQKPSHRKVNTCINTNFSNNLLNFKNSQYSNSNNSNLNYKEDFYKNPELELFRGKIIFKK